MSKYCPAMKFRVTYMDCLECEEKECKVIKREYNGIRLNESESVSHYTKNGRTFIRPGYCFRFKTKGNERWESEQVVYLGRMKDKQKSGLFYLSGSHGKKGKLIIMKPCQLKETEIRHVGYNPWWENMKKRILSDEGVKIVFYESGE